MNKKTTIDGPIYDARQLGTPKMLLLGLQHMFAMFGATVLVPALTGLNVATALLFAGIGTLLFHLLTGGKVPAFLGSSFAFIGGYNAIRTIGAAADGSPIYDNALLPYACFGVLIAGLMYVILSVLFKTFGVKKVMRFFPPIVTGPIIIAIGLTLSSSAINNCKANWLVAIVAIAIVIGFNMWGKGMTKIIPILLGVLGSYIFALIVDPAERAAVSEAVSNAAWIGLPVHWNRTVFGLFAGEVDSSLLWSSTSATSAQYPPPSARTSCLTPASTAPSSATVWQPPWQHSSAAPRTPPTVKTPASSRCPRSTTPASSASQPASRSSSPSARSLLLSSPQCPPRPSAACPSSSTV